ncbi:MAG: 2-amino-4-hydroxy-6-hydroxymethyldihydropteridine diphosphokinase [Muribaculaceae bacterium]|nr:2-amino-4-hydroxy-6-hydroxymethyldihydropteridine diphosphokinase [Muribaculaceae bacterium]
MAKIHINIGSNTGDRAAQIERAVAALCERLDPSCRAEIRLAPIEESEPWGFESANKFLNLGLMVDMPGDVEPFAVLDVLQTVENDISDAPHRNADGSYADRPIDIDLIAIDDRVIDTPHLQLPHPRMHLRDFILRPVAALDPSWRHPLTGMTTGQMLSEL